MAFDFGKVKEMFNTLKEKGTAAAGKAADKTKDAARMAKLGMELNTEKENLKKAYLELGKAFYEEHRGSAEGLAAQLCEEVSAVTARISSIQSELDGLKESFKPAEEPAFEDVVDSEEPDITVELTEDGMCEACEAEKCDDCAEAEEGKEECCCEDEKAECCEPGEGKEECCCTEEEPKE